MRDLIDRQALLSFMERVEYSLHKEGATESYINGYRAAMKEIERAAAVKVEDAK